MFWIDGGELSIDKLFLGDFVVSGFVPAELRFHQDAVAGAVPWHIARFVTLRHDAT